jgi:diguanylate cyclase (GGDEF)-like protein
VNVSRRALVPSTIVLVVVAVAAFLWSVRPGPVFGIVVYEGTGYALAVTVVLATLVRRPTRRWPWFLLAAMIAFDVSGDLVYDLTELLRHTPGYTSMLSDVFYLASYPAVIAATVVLLVRRGRRNDVAIFIDAGVYAVAAWLAIWVVTVHPSLASSNISFWDWIPTVIYPPLDLIVLVAIWRIGRGDLRRSAPWLLLAFGFAVMVVADVLFAVLHMPDAGFWSAALSICYLVSYGVIAAAAVHPQMGQVEAAPEPTFRPASQNARVVGLAVALAVPTLLLVAWPTEVAEVPELTGVAAAILVVGGMARALAVINRHRHAESALAWQAIHDPLTGLPNRSAFVAHVDVVARRARRLGSGWTLLYCDLDEFKVINDSLGHTAGDELLVAVADRLRTVLRKGDFVARFGGDEFVVLCEHSLDAQASASAAARIARALDEPFMIGGTELHVSASVGVVAGADELADNAEALLRDADLAMYSAKTKGRGRVESFHAEMRREIRDRLATENALRKALLDDDLRLAFQPIVSIAEGSVVAWEALLRWDRGPLGLVPPADFVPLAESLGLILDIGAWTLRQASRKLRSLQESNADVRVTVNISARELRQPDMAQRAFEIVQTELVGPEGIVLEITESALLEPTDAVRANLVALHDAGFRFAIDDFGTGYSSLAYLEQLDVEIIKIDRIFISRLGNGGKDPTLVRAIINMAHSLGVTVTAEGIERPNQLEVLRALGCDHGQGFLFGRPEVESAEEPRHAVTATGMDAL